MRFLVDAQLPPALARWLTAQGHTAEHVIDVSLADANDRVVWTFAHAHVAVIVTKDEDFALRRAREVTGPQVVWIRVGNTSRPELLDWFRFRLPAIVDALSRGEPLIEII